MVKCKNCDLIKKEGELCFFHITKNNIIDCDIKNVKEWIDTLDINSWYSDDNRKTLSSLTNYTFKRLLQQKALYKREQCFVEEVADYILQKSIEKRINIHPETITLFLKKVKIKLNYVKYYLKEKHFMDCIKVQGYGLSESIYWCNKNKSRGKELKEVINFYRKRDEIIFTKLHHLPLDIVKIIIEMLD